MKVLFSASVTGRDTYEEYYHEIEKGLDSLGHEVIAPVFLANKEELAKEEVEKSRRYFTNLMGWISEADVVVFETSYPSTGVGYEIATCLNLGKPVIALHVKGKVPHFLNQIDNEKFQLIEYTLNNLKKELKSAVGFASDLQDTRFNFFISSKHQNYLNWISRSRKIPRAVFLRNLIEAQIKKNSNY